MSINHQLDFALRVCESVAFFLHGFLGITEPLTGCLRNVFQENGTMPRWFWPVAGCILWLVSYLNFCGNDDIILANQFYIMAFHIGGVLYHRKLSHHPASGVGPGMFVLLGFIVASMRTSMLFLLSGLCVCTFIAMGLSNLLIKVPSDRESSQLYSSASHTL